MADNRIMRSFRLFPSESKSKIRYVLTDIDDTLTVKGRLPSVIFSAMEKLQQNQIHVIPITGRPAGWCDHIARMWPVAGLVGENGAFYFFYDTQQKKMIRRYFKSRSERLRDQKKLDTLKEEILRKVPGSDVSADQAYREADLAIDFCEDVDPLPTSSIDTIIKLFEKAGAQAKPSSIHVNGWFGSYDKLTMTKRLLKEIYSIDVNHQNECVLYIGDSPNDCPMFDFFQHSVGVANIHEYKGALPSEPAWVTERIGGYGFAEMVEILLS